MSLREQEIAILTYRSLHLYEFKQSPKFNLRKLDTFQLPAMPQAEAMSFLSDGRLVVYSEKVGSPVVMFRRSQPVTLNTKPLYSRIQQ